MSKLAPVDRLASCRPHTIFGDPRFAAPPIDGSVLGVRTWVNGIEVGGDDLTTWQELYDRLRERFALLPSSPCIDAGVAVTGVTGSFNGAAPDIGPFESGD